MTPQKKIIYYKIVIIFLSILLFGASFYSYKAYQRKQNEIIFFQSEKKLFLDEIHAMTTRYKSAKDNNNLKTREIENYKNRVNKLQEEIKSNNDDYFNLIHYRKKLNDLKLERDYLYKVNDSLINHNDLLLQERDYVKDKLFKNMEETNKLVRENSQYELIIKSLQE